MRRARPIAVVTGAGSGIGAAIAARLASRYDLILTHMEDDHQKIGAVLNAVNSSGAEARFVFGDLLDSSTIEELSCEIQGACDRIEVTVTNAGSYPRTSWSMLSIEEFSRQIDINLVAHAACIQLVTPAMSRNSYGRIITVSSVLTQVGRVDLAAYIAAKSGVEGLSRALARELGPYGITVNCIRPGSIEVEAEKSVISDPDGMLIRQLERQCIKRRGQPDDVAAMVEFLASRQAGFITGQCVTVDGGWCMT